MMWRSGLMLIAVALSSFALPASAALYAEVTPPAASVELVPDQTYTYTYEPGYVEQRSYTVTVETQPGFVERRIYIVETPQSEPRVVIEHY